MLSRLRKLLLGPEATAIVLVMGVGCLGLWIAVPVGWLWIGSQVEASADLSTGLGVAMIGSLASIVLIAALLAKLNQRHLRLQELRHGQERPRTSALELMLVVTAAIALVVFGIWFLLFAGTSPAPVNISF